ncbi:protein of unknown function [Streptantibioticus cattleyicolor NRRL 8057 = DSM 46488]|nr:protein of unknown function [Streptantibioticus cattleyicolor NRRL 8057 = DSM 46488]
MAGRVRPAEPTKAAVSAEPPRDAAEARLAVREAARWLAEEAPALTAAGAEAREAGLAARVAGLRKAVVAAYRAGVPVTDLAVDAGVSPATVERWLARGERRGPYGGSRLDMGESDTYPGH